MERYLLSHLVTVLGALAAFAMMSGLGGGGARRTSQSTLAWILALVFVPFVAIPLFLLLGSRKFPTRAKGPVAAADRIVWRDEEKTLAPPVARVLQASGVRPPCAGNSFRLITTGEDAYEALTTLIRGAEHSIDLTIFILARDATGDAMVEALRERAKAGVRVRVILDAVGSSRALGHAAMRIGEAGGEVRSFMPLAHSPIRGRTNLRSHRKLVVVDDEHVFTGGMNLANEYMGPKPMAKRWRDVAAITSGPIAADGAAMFESDWFYCGGKPREVRPAVARESGEAIVQIVPSGPDLPTDTVYDLFLSGIFAAKKRIALVTPYYVPDDQLQHALVLAAARGVRTEVLVPTVSNHALADVARRNLLRDLTASGVVVHYYPLGMVHAKAMVIDDAFAYVGSPNFDMRSLFLNYENALCVYSAPAIGAIREYIDGLIAQSNDVSPVKREHRIIEQLARFLAPEL